ncbi:hypothetical protein G7046_g3027 [Stylonectria norvegica]|nr:hypothetical protein G7046_g3027 [Stylonectria norvegica]
MEQERPADSILDIQRGKKRPPKSLSDARYPRKRSLKACHVCRGRKTKCDNVQPTCGFCASLSIQCSFDVAEKDHSSFDPASLEILRQLGRIISSQDDLLQSVRSAAVLQPQSVALNCSPSIAIATQEEARDDRGHADWNNTGDQQTQHLAYVNSDWFGQPLAATTTSPAASTSVAAVRWFGLLAQDVSREAFQPGDAPLELDGGFLGLLDGQDESDTSPLQRATRMIDGQPEASDPADKGFAQQGSPASNQLEESMWRASENISLLDREQILFTNFLHRICSWIDLFDPARTFSTRVPHLALRNAGLLNAILALSGYYQSLDESVETDKRPDQNSALEYYYQTLHYVQRAMRYATYQNSQELMATTLIVSTYEMLRGSRKDWQQHLKGVFWILRSRQIEVEASSLESTTWWAWLRQDIWVAFREKRKTYTTWLPKKRYAELNGHELASRAVWIFAQVINFCAVDKSEEDENALSVRLSWAKTLRKLLEEWRSHLTVEFSPLPTISRSNFQAFQPRLIYPQCFGLAMQVHHASRILTYGHEPCLDGFEEFAKRQKTIQDSIEMVCGIGMTLTEDASSMMSSQCLFIEPPTEEQYFGYARLLPEEMRLANTFIRLGAGADLGDDETFAIVSLNASGGDAELYLVAAISTEIRSSRDLHGGVVTVVLRLWVVELNTLQNSFGVNLTNLNKREFGLENRPPSAAADLSGNLVTTMQAGAVAGALVSSTCADKWGRKPALLAVAITGLIGGLMQAFSYGHLPVFYIGRFIEGLGLGAGTMLSPTYVSENAPRAIRGFLVGFFQLLLVMGGMMAYFINYGSLLHLPGKTSWMVPLGCQSICPALLFVSMLLCPESPRWLASQDQWDKACAVLSDVRQLPAQHPYIQQELLEMRTQLDHERVIMRATGFWAIQKDCWTIPSNRKRALLTIGIITFQQWSGTGAINYYAPTIFKSLGLSSTTTALFAQGVYGIVKVVTCLIFVLFLADSLGRRMSFMWSGALQAFCMFFLGFYVRFGPTIKADSTASPPPAGIAALAMIYIFAAAFNMGWGPVSWVYVSEIPTNRLRAYNVALAALTHWLNNLAVSKATPVLLLKSPYRAYFIFGTLNLIMAVAAFWIPETKGISLERMDEVFGVADFSDIEDVGNAAKRAKELEEEVDQTEDVQASKV